MRKTGVIACFALLLTITGTRAGPLFNSKIGTDLASADDNAIAALSNNTSPGTVICHNGTDSTCSPGFDSIIGVIQNTTANVTKTPGFDSIVGVIQNSTSNITKTPSFDTIIGVIQNSTANITKTPSFDSIVGIIENSTANITKTPGFGSIVGVIQNSTANITKTPGFDSIIGVIQNTTANASVASGNNGKRVTVRNTPRNDTTRELLLNDEDASRINEAVDGNSSVCPPLVSREGWGGRPPLAVEKVRTPVPFVVIHHTYIPGACNTSDDCEAKMRSMQDFHMGKGWNNVGYNFIVGGDNRVYIGRGWDVVGAHSPVYNFKSVGISFIGDYRTELPTQDMMELAWSVIRCGVARGSISETYKLVGHRQVRDTECPGDRLYQEIQTWPHWVAHRDIIPRTNTTSSSAPK